MSGLVGDLCTSIREGETPVEATLHLGVVDQSPIRAGGTAADALRETIALAVATEAMGYER